MSTLSADFGAIAFELRRGFGRDIYGRLRDIGVKIPKTATDTDEWTRVVVKLPETDKLAVERSIREVLEHAERRKMIRMLPSTPRCT